MLTVTALQDLDRTALRRLAPAEQDFLDGLRHPGRRQSWLAGRLAVRQALAALCGAGSDHAWSVLPDAAGRPRLDGFPGPAPALSISHSGDLAVAAAAFLPGIGVDVERLAPRLVRLAGHFLQAEERRVVDRIPSTHSPMQKLGLAWSAKEAFKKAMPGDQPPALAGIRIRKLRRMQHGGWDLDMEGPAGERQAVSACIIGKGAYSLALAPAMDLNPVCRDLGEKQCLNCPRSR